MNYTSVIVLDRENNCYVAWHPEFGACISDGATVEEARANLAEVLGMTLDHLREFNLPIPEPMDWSRQPVKIDLGQVM